MRLITLGDLRLESSELTRPTPLLLLAYLRLEGRRSRRVLAELFFADARDPRDSLSNAVRRIAREAPGALAEDGSVVTANEFGCDALELLAAAHDDPERAAALHRGPFLEGLELSLGVELEEWVFETREMLARSARDAHLRLADAATALGDDATAHEEREQAAALATRTGIEELDEPWEHPRTSDHTDESETPPSSPRVVLPPLRTRFIGRERELSELLERLRDPTVRILTLYGIGGVGKSRLASELARRAVAAALPEGADGVLFVPLDGVDTASGLARAVAVACGFEAMQPERLPDLATELRDEQILLVLDTFEQLLPHAPDLADLVDACAGITVVVTSRARLDLTGEVAWRVRGLATDPAPIDRDTATPSEAEALLLERMSRLRPTRPALGGSADLAAARRICLDLEGLPLAIEFAAGMARALPLPLVAEEVATALPELGGGPSDGPDRHRSVRAVFESGWRRLTGTERALLTRLAAFAGSFDRDAANAVAAAGSATLLRLADRALVAPQDHGRFHIHAVSHACIRTAAREDPELEPETATAERIHVDYFRALARRCAEQVVRDPSAALRAADADLPNLLAAAENAFGAGREGDAFGLLEDLVVHCDYLAARGRNDRLIALIERGIDAAERTGASETAHLLATKLANVYRELDGDLARARDAYLRALRLAEAYGDEGRQAIVHGALALIEAERDPPRSAAHLARARELAEHSGSGMVICWVLQNASVLANVREAWHEMEALCRRVLAVAEETLRGIPGEGGAAEHELERVRYFALHNLGVALDFQERFDEAQRWYEAALEHARARRQFLWEAFALDELGQLHHTKKRPDEAAKAYERARNLYRATGARHDLKRLEHRMVEQGYALPAIVSALPDDLQAESRSSR